MGVNVVPPSMHNSMMGPPGDKALGLSGKTNIMLDMSQIRNPQSIKSMYMSAQDVNNSLSSIK